jgi:hypothetical protein
MSRTLKQTTALLFALVFAELLFASGTAASQLLNISTRAYVGADDRALIGGFILDGGYSKRLLLRGIGPSLADAGLADVLNDPTLELRDQNGVVVFSNDNWQDWQKSEIEQTNLPPPNDREAAIVLDVRPWGNYTVLLRDAAGRSGIGLIEIFDLSPTAGTLANVSTRGFVETGDRVMIGGVIIGGGNHSEQIITRGLGPSLADLGMQDSLADPTLELRSSAGLLATNDNWKTDQRTIIEQSGIPPGHELESAIVSNLSPGSYTAILRGHGDGVGTGLVEFYHLTSNSTPTATFSFEDTMEGWTPKGTDLDHPDLTWSIEPSEDRATDGKRSLRFALDNVNDAGKIWIERPFAVQPNEFYHVTVQFSFGTQDWGEANLWNIIAGVRTSPAVTRNDLTYQDSTGGGSRDTGYQWLEKSYDFHLVSGPDGTLYVDIGLWGNWETFRAYYIDNVRITISEN